MIAQLKEALEAVPPLKELTGCRSESALITAFVNGWYNRPAYKMQLVRAKQRAAKTAEDVSGRYRLEQGISLLQQVTELTSFRSGEAAGENTRVSACIWPS